MNTPTTPALTPANPTQATDPIAKSAEKFEHDVHAHVGERLAPSEEKRIGNAIRIAEQQRGTTEAGSGHAQLGTPEYRDEQVKFNKAMRAELDSTLQKVKGSPSSRERSLVITKIQEAVMWLGMDLKRLNEPNPYSTSYREFLGGQAQAPASSTNP